MGVPILTAALVARFEAAESASYESRLGAVSRLPGNPFGIELARFGEAGHVSARLAHGNAALNHVQGLGPDDAGLLDDVLGWYRERGTSGQLVVAPFRSSPGLLRALAGRGLTVVGLGTVLYGVPEPGRPPPALGVDVEVLSAEDLRALVAVVAEGAGWHEPGVAPTQRALWERVTAAQFQGVDRADWRCYVVRVGGVPAAVAALHVRDGIGSLTFDGTTPRFRGRGCQTALIHRRIADSAAAGCDVVLTQTDPGSSSQRNMERAGLRTAYTRTVWAPATHEGRP